MGGVPAAGPGAPARSCTAGQGPLSRLKKICLSPPLYSHCRSVYPQPFPSHPPQKFKERWKNQAEVPALATFASDARRDLGILPAAYLASPKAHQEQNERIRKKPHHFGLSTQSGSISSGAGAKAAVVIPANSPGKEPRPTLRRRPGSCKTQLMLETHAHTHTQHTHVYLHTQLSLYFLYIPPFMDSAVGKGCRIAVSSPPGKRAGTFLRPEVLSAPSFLSRGVETRTVVSGVKAEPLLLLSFRGMLQPEGRDGVGTVRLPAVQFPFQKLASPK